MFKTMRTGVLTLAAAAAMCFMAQDAQAGCGYGGGGGGGGYYGGGYGGGYVGNYGGYGGGFSRSRSGISVGYRGFSSRSRNVGYRSTYRAPHRSAWHDTSHVDYQPGIAVRHGNHYDYIPGHYDVHRTGHWH